MPHFPNSIRPLLLAAGGLVAAGVLPSCDDGPNKAVLERRIDQLELEIEILKRKNEESADFTDATATDFKDRLAQAEQKSQEALQQAGTAITQQKARFERLEKSVSSVLRIKEQSESMAYLSPSKVGHRTLQTGHGPFLVRLEGLEREALNNRFLANLSVGNPNGLMIQEFTLKGEFGQPAPELKPGEAYSEYSERLDTWQKTLTPFEESFVKMLEPNSWTPVELPLNAPNLESLKMMRFTMIIRRAHLAGNSGEPEYSVINTGGTGASLVKTDYGPFLVTVSRMETEGATTRVYLTIGNPFGFVVNEATLKGEFGPAPPRQMDSEPAEIFRRRLHTWSEQMAPFEANLSGAIAPFRWSDASVSIPTSDRSKVSYIRCQMNVVNITLPKAP